MKDVWAVLIAEFSVSTKGALMRKPYILVSTIRKKLGGRLLPWAVEDPAETNDSGTSSETMKLKKTSEAAFEKGQGHPSCKKKGKKKLTRKTKNASSPLPLYSGNTAVWMHIYFNSETNER
ncbi:hypothetical protein CEXT_556231 [Caerostris extrusa]|uniref:Uncharacterized protein n=1 Tax=Caerostris extrusa TaxID=172846 RepID=A0AAV4X2S9_CAEEX|nr:hypothetical protein CEXT_556231 [Caerostris extrusa]